MVTPARADCRYTPYYCEENIWHLAADDRLPAGDRFVALITNPGRTCALWSQRAAPPAEPIVWDYHVILLVAGHPPQVWDLDSRLPFPCPLDDYLAATFPLGDHIDEPYRPAFRIVAGDLFRSHFESDRSHMRGPDGGWLQPPPPWPAIGGGGSNLEQLLTLERRDPGEVCDLQGLRQRFGLGR